MFFDKLTYFKAVAITVSKKAIRDGKIRIIDSKTNSNKHKSSKIEVFTDKLGGKCSLTIVFLFSTRVPKFSSY